MVRHLTIPLLALSLVFNPPLEQAFSAPLSIPAPSRMTIFDQTAFAMPGDVYPGNDFTKKATLRVYDRAMFVGGSPRRVARRTLFSVGVFLLGMIPLRAQSVEYWISQLDSPDSNVRAKAREQLVRESQKQDWVNGQLTEYKPVFNAVDSAFVHALEKKTSAHLAVGAIKVMAYIMPVRALRMSQDLIHRSDDEVTHMYEAAGVLSRAPMSRNPTPYTIEDWNAKLNTLTNLGRRYVALYVRSNNNQISLHDLTASAPYLRDFYLSIHYAALAATLQTSFILWDDKTLYALMGKILDESEVDPFFESSFTIDFKVGDRALASLPSPATWVFASARVLGSHWINTHNKILATKLSINANDQINEFVSDILGLAALEQLNMLQDAALRDYLGRQSNAARLQILSMLEETPENANRWANLVNALKRDVPKVTADTTFAEFVHAVTGVAPVVNPGLPRAAAILVLPRGPLLRRALLRSV